MLRVSPFTLTEPTERGMDDALCDTTFAYALESDDDETRPLTQEDLPFVYQSASVFDVPPDHSREDPLMSLATAMEELRTFEGGVSPPRTQDSDTDTLFERAATEPWVVDEEDTELDFLYAHPTFPYVPYRRHPPRSPSPLSSSDDMLLPFSLPLDGLCGTYDDDDRDRPPFFISSQEDEGDTPC